MSLMQLSWFALSTHKEIPKNLNEIQHKRQHNTIANYTYTKGLKHAGIFCGGCCFL